MGQIILPTVLWTAIAKAPIIEPFAPGDVRARNLATAYPEIGDDPTGSSERFFGCRIGRPKADGRVEQVCRQPRF